MSLNTVSEDITSEKVLVDRDSDNEAQSNQEFNHTDVLFQPLYGKSYQTQ
jgi:hypothetical protein